MERHAGEQVNHGVFGGGGAVLCALLGLLLAACGVGSSAAIDGDSRLVIHIDRELAEIDPRIFGTNLPAWVGPDALADAAFRARTIGLGTTVLRMPGGSWSNHYDWHGCEVRDRSRCHWPWAARPTDFLDFLRATDIPGMWTVSVNGTAQEAAAVVAFFNGRVGDDRPLGIDRNGRDWRTVGHWAELRARHGNVEPEPIRLWEVGNEVFGAVPEAGEGCAAFGWEEVWTCDGTEYALGTDEHDGFLDFRAAMRRVDPGIEVGAVGVAEQVSWGRWGDEVIDAAGKVLDFYVVHHYAFDSSPAPDDVLGVPLRTWGAIVEDVEGGFETHGLAPADVAVTEYNLVAFAEGDDAKVMEKAVNGLYVADTIGQLAVHGVDIANQWDLSNGERGEGTDYGLFTTDGEWLAPQYYGLALWTRMGDELLAVDAVPWSTVSAYATRADDGSIRVLVLNKTGHPYTTTIALEPGDERFVGVVDVVRADALDDEVMTYNGTERPSADLSEPPGDALGVIEEPFSHRFAPYSITLLRLDPAESDR
jgi:hypothetical protein